MQQDFDRDFIDPAYHNDDDWGESPSYLFSQIRFTDFEAEVLDDVIANGEDPEPVMARLERIRQPGFLSRMDWDRLYRNRS